VLQAALKRKNAFVFREEQISIHQLFLLCKGDATLWKQRLSKKSKRVAEEWIKAFDQAISRNNL